MKGELRVQCSLSGARTTAGILYAGDFNLSSDRTRSGMARYLAERSRAKLEWGDLIEEVCQRVLAADAEGEPAQDLRDVPRPGAEEVLRVQGLSLLARHPTVLFGDGGTAKSYLALAWSGYLAALDELRVGYFDWELDGASHRERLERLYPGAKTPSIVYARCSRPFSFEAERLRRIVDQHRLQYVVFDSIAPACDGRPEDAEVAARYFQHLRQLGEIGSLHIAHVSKSQDGSQLRPFGSTFWHNLARATWNVQADQGDGGGTGLKVALHNRKANMGPVQKSVAYQIWFGGDRTRVSLASFENEPALAEGLSLRHRIEIALRQTGSALGVDMLAEELGAKRDTIHRTVRRHRDRFELLDGGRVALSGGGR